MSSKVDLDEDKEIEFLNKLLLKHTVLEEKKTSRYKKYSPLQFDNNFDTVRETQD